MCNVDFSSILGLSCLVAPSIPDSETKDFCFHFFFSSEVIKKAPAIEGKCSRTFITFTDEKVFNEHFSRKKTRIPVKNYCPVTRLPAKYFDPITQTPFSNVQAFKVIRDTYIQQMEQQSEKKAQEQSQTRRIRQQPVTVAAQ